MALTVPDRATADLMIGLLRAARDLIRTGACANICGALSEADGYGRSLACDLILAHVRHGLEGAGILAQYIVNRIELRDPIAAGAMSGLCDDWYIWIFQQCRLAWIDKMIFDLEAPRLEAEHWAALEERWADKSLD